LCRLREGLGEGVGNWFEDNIRRVVGDGRDTFSGMIFGWGTFL